MASEPFEGIVSELERSGAGDGAVSTFWLIADNGTRAFVEFHRDLPLRNGDRVEVTGERDSQGTLQGTSIRDVRVAAKPDPVKALEWRRLMLSVVVSPLIGGLAEFSRGKGPGLEIIGQIILYFPVSFFACLILTNLLVNYRRAIHTVISAALVLPVAFLFLVIGDKLFQ
ncbi:hypothetical protein SBA3_290012 [Candidatus Sulfopaludibacter sp. SbA3]|nr:hypothetical protein SBA3_290012 [Candidatus Sulfopaludibacter sp. SbA3]